MYVPKPIHHTKEHKNVHKTQWGIGTRFQSVTCSYLGHPCNIASSIGSIIYNPAFAVYYNFRDVYPSRRFMCAYISRWKVIYIIISYRCCGGRWLRGWVGGLLCDDLAQENRDKHPVGGVRRAGGMRAFFSRLYAQAAYIHLCVCVYRHVPCCCV